MLCCILPPIAYAVLGATASYYSYVVGLPVVTYHLIYKKDYKPALIMAGSAIAIEVGKKVYNTIANKDYLHHNVTHILLDSPTKEIVASDRCTAGSSENERFIITNKEQSHIFGKGGLDTFKLGEGEDHLYFSMCSTKIIDGKVNTVYDFNPKQDKVHLFCTKKTIDPEDISLNKDGGVTYIMIEGKFERTGIALQMLDDQEFSMDNIELNIRYMDVCEVIA